MRNNYYTYLDKNLKQKKQPFNPDSLMIIVVVTLITIGVALLTLSVFCAAIEWDKTGTVPDGWTVTSSEDDDDFFIPYSYWEYLY